jgi:3-hydroxybutyrate dehydrogenase
MPSQLHNKTALVTGAAGGIGREIAGLFGREGANVAIADIDAARAAGAASEIQSEGAQALAVTMDVTNEADVNAGVAATIERFGSVDILVSNAGIQIVDTVHEFSFEDWRRIIAVHLDGAFLTTKACLPHMYASGRGGSIIYMGSAHSKTASVMKAPYVAAKHALIGLARTVAKEGAPHGVRANVICPGFVRTFLVEKQIPEQARSLGMSEEDVVQRVMLHNTVDGQFTTVDEVARAALFFAAFPSLALTGQSLLVSHGWIME